MNNCIRYSRCQVWIADIPKCEGHLQYGKRPILIISSNVGNTRNGFVLGLPITSRDKKCCDVNVIYFDNNEHKNTVICNQPIRISCNRLLKYMYTLSDDIMLNVERGYLIANSMERYIEDASMITSSVNDLVTQIKVLNDHKYTKSKQAEDALCNINKTLLEAINDIKLVRDDMLNDIKSDPYTDYLVRKKLDIVEDSNSDNESCDIQESKGGMPRGFWKHSSNILQFLSDSVELSAEELADKYKFATPQSAKKAVYRYRWKLNSGQCID